MAVIGKIRSYSGLLIAVIGIALAAFVLGDFFGYGPTRSQSLEVGSAGKSKIMYRDFEEKVAQAIENWRNQTGNQNPGIRETFQIRQQVWDQLLKDILMDVEYEKLGLKIHPDELSDMIIGNNPHPAILQSFTNPNDGSFDPQSVINFLQNMSSGAIDPSVQNQWFMLEDFIKDQRKEAKYHNLIRKGYYMPDILVQADYQDKNASIDLTVALLRYTDIDDSLVVITDRELRRTYNEHKHKHKREASRDLEYVVFPIFPSEQDQETIRLQTERLMPEFATAENVETFINSNSDDRFNPTFFSRGQLSPIIDSIMFNAPVGTMYGPFIENNAFVVAKLNDVQLRPDSIKAAHILIAFKGSRSAAQEVSLTRDQAKVKADSILGVVRRNPASFSSLASVLSNDPSASSNQGDLGWFADGAMVPAFNQAVIDNPINSFTVAESEFGFHVIHITGKSSPTKKVQVARLTRNIEYSNQTFQRVFGQASAFSAALRNNDDFDAVVEGQGLSKRIVDNIKPMDNAIPGIENPRGIIQWAFAERTNKGGVSQIFDLDGRFVVARVSRIREEGIPSLNEIKDEIRTIAIREKKGQILIDKINQAAGNTLEEKAESLNTDSRLLENIRFNNNNLFGFGPEPAVVGSAFAMEIGKLNQVKGNNGVYLVRVNSNEPGIEPENWSLQRTQILSSFRNRVPGETFRVLRENAQVKDNRHMFY